MLWYLKVKMVVLQYMEYTHKFLITKLFSNVIFYQMTSTVQYGDERQIWDNHSLNEIQFYLFIYLR